MKADNLHSRSLALRDGFDAVQAHEVRVSFSDVLRNFVPFHL